MSKLAHSCDETMAAIAERHHRNEDGGDLMRAAADEFLAWSVASDAQDLLYAVREMNPTQRANVLPEIEEALALLTSCKKECL